MTSNINTGKILVEEGIITAEQLETAIKETAKNNESLEQALIQLGFVYENQILQVLARQQGIPFLELKDINIDDEVIEKVPAKLVWHYKVMPLKIKGGILTLAVSDKTDMLFLDDIEAHLGYRVKKVLVSSSDIMETIRKYYGVGADTIEHILSDDSYKLEKEEISAPEKIEDLEKLAGDASLVKLVNQILQQAINDRATDIHIEHFRGELLLRYRVDGVLYETSVSADIKYLYPAIISRIKVMGGMDIVERRLPQDGRAKVKIGASEYELRISIIPTLYGENIVIRILPVRMLFNITDLGMLKRESDIVEQLINKPYGVIFVTGPTGSGKSTTLYACLSKLNTKERKIITIEDPIEYELRGISQIQANPKVGLTFARALRSMLRQDPDIIMVGEIRDFETAEITIQAALTGHLVFSTVHTNDAASGVTRLIDIGVEPYLIASSVEAFIAQRLVRTICDKCKQPQELNELDGFSEELKLWAQDLKGRTVFKAKGCKLCNDTGYMGRTGIYEILLVNDEIRRLIFQKVSVDILKKKAIELGMRTLRQDGWEKVLLGITTPEEVMRVTQI